MKILHLSDIHIGKRFKEISLIDDQKYILLQILNIIDNENIQIVIIAGDIYDKAIPSVEAVELFDEFLVNLQKRNLKVFIISGNHDSPQRLAFASKIMNNSGIYISPVYKAEVVPVTIADENCEINIYMLPFIKPANVRSFFPEEEIDSYTKAVDIAIKNMAVDTDKINILVTHQFATGGITSESEEIFVGGSDNVDLNVFADFDYVALGHLHRAQNIKSEKVRYCGTPLKYSFSESSHTKTVTVLEISTKDNLTITEFPLIPKYDMREIKGEYLEITSKKNYKNTNTDDYLHITLTDELDIPNAMHNLKVIYPNLLKLDYDNKRTRQNNIIDADEQLRLKSPIELFKELYEKQNNQEMQDIQIDFLEKIMEELSEEDA